MARAAMASRRPPIVRWSSAQSSLTPSTTMSAVRDRQYKVIRQHTTEPFELFDLIYDPRETKNVIAEKPHIAKALEQAYLRWLEATAE